MRGFGGLGFKVRGVGFESSGASGVGVQRSRAAFGELRLRVS